MVSHLGSLCEKCGSDKYEYITKGLEKRQILAATCFVSVPFILSSLFVGVFLAAILTLAVYGIGISLAVQANPKTVTFCTKCKSEGTMHGIGTPKGKELYEKYYKDK